MVNQWQKCWFNTENNKFTPTLPNEPTREEINIMLSPNNKNCPLNKIILSEENEGNMQTLRMFAHTAYKKYNRCCHGMSFALYASSGQGKTYILRQFAKTIGIPFVFVQSDILTSTEVLLDCIIEEFDKHYKDEPAYKIVEVAEGEYKIPPCIVAFDEAHAIPKKLMQGGLLNAMEANDGILAITTGTGDNRRTITVDCRNICWIAATTEEGRLFDAFAQRLETKITWCSAGPKEIARIIKLNYPNYSQEACELVAKFCRVPREAKAFARKMGWHKEQWECTWEEAANAVAKNSNLDEFGMHIREVNLLKALGQGRIARRNLPSVIGVKEEALDNNILPPLMEHNGRGPFIKSTSRGMAITMAGLKELDMRNIPHKGKTVSFEYFSRR